MLKEEFKIYLVYLQDNYTLMGITDDKSNCKNISKSWLYNNNVRDELVSLTEIDDTEYIEEGLYKLKCCYESWVDNSIIYEVCSEDDLIKKLKNSGIRNMVLEYLSEDYANEIRYILNNIKIRKSI